MRSQRDGGSSTITKVKGYSLEITMLHGAKGSISWKPESLYASKGECAGACRGPRPW